MTYRKRRKARTPPAPRVAPPQPEMCYGIDTSWGVNPRPDYPRPSAPITPPPGLPGKRRRKTRRGKYHAR